MKTLKQYLMGSLPVADHFKDVVSNYAIICTKKWLDEKRAVARTRFLYGEECFYIRLLEELNNERR